MFGFLKRLFGKSDGTSSDEKSVDIAGSAPNEIYKDVEIRANPSKEQGGQWRVAGTITKNIDTVTITRKFIRADLLQSRDEAIIASVNKAKTIIDHGGADLWSGSENQPV